MLGSASVLAQIADSNSSLATTSLSVHSHADSLGLHRFRINGLSQPLDNTATFTVDLNFSRWGEGP